MYTIEDRAGLLPAGLCDREIDIGASDVFDISNVFAQYLRKIPIVAK